MPTIDLDAYCRRIAYDGPRAPTLDTLRALHRLHPAAIPFENLSPFSGAPVRIELEAIEQKLVRDQRGGYCFEHNLLFLEVLRAIGFRASGLAARVLWNQPEDAITPRSHMLLRVELDGATYVADVGFGGQVLTAPLRLEEDIVQPTPHEPFRLIRGADGDLRMQSDVRGEWKTLYRFDLAPQYPIDYAIANYWVSTHPASHFRTSLIVARVVEGKRYALSNRQLTVHHLGGPSERRTLDHAELRDVLEQTFGIRVPASQALDAAIAALP